MITWKKDPFQSEYIAFKEKSDYYSINRKDATDKLHEVKLEYNKSNKINLSQSIWKRLDLSTSWGVSSLNELFLNLKRSGKKKNVSRLLTQFIGNGEVNDWMGSVSCPIICKHLNGDHSLVAGNIRLSICYLLDIRPQVIIVETDW